MAALTTVTPKGYPQTSVVWFDFDGACARVNTTLERQKGRNLLANPKVSLLVVDPDNPGRYLQVRGHAELVFDGALDHLDALTRKYTRHPAYYGHIYRPRNGGGRRGSSAASMPGASPWTRSTPEPDPTGVPRSRQPSQPGLEAQGRLVMASSWRQT